MGICACPHRHAVVAKTFRTCSDPDLINKGHWGYVAPPIRWCTEFHLRQAQQIHLYFIKPRDILALGREQLKGKFYRKLR